MTFFFHLGVNWQKDYNDNFKRLLHKVLIWRRRRKNKKKKERMRTVCVVICQKISNRTDFFDTTVPEWSICKLIICKMYECMLVQRTIYTRFIWINMQPIPRAKWDTPKNKMHGDFSWFFSRFILLPRHWHCIFSAAAAAAALVLHIMAECVCVSVWHM